MPTIKLTKDVSVISSSPNTLVFDNRIIVDQGGKNSSIDINAEVQLATHGHADHIAGLFKKDAKIRYLPIEDYWTLNIIGRRALVYGFSSKNSDIFMYDYIKDNLEFLDNNIRISEVEVIKLPGHTPGHSGYIIGDVLYAGDAFFGDKVLEGYSVPFYIDFWEAEQSLYKIKELAKSVQNIVISHGPIYNKNKMITLLEHNINYLHNIVNKILDLISMEELTAEQIAVKLKPDISPTNILLNTITIKSLLLGLDNIEYEVKTNGLVFRKRKH
ncbi:MBL fold metallo-hydrolase [Sulfolobus sp. B5]|nr:MBL fold metallo-hydrolase [Sulfolobus sp. B5]